MHGILCISIPLMHASHRCYAYYMLCFPLNFTNSVTELPIARESVIYMRISLKSAI